MQHYVRYTDCGTLIGVGHRLGAQPVKFSGALWCVHWGDLLGDDPDSPGASYRRKSPERSG